MAKLVTIEGGQGLRVIAGKLSDPSEALEGIGAYLTSQTQKAFREQRRGDSVWPGRMTPNVPGIVSDLNRGSTPPGRRFSDRPALVDTGRLRASISWRRRGRGEVVVGTQLDYAPVHQRGGNVDVVLTPTGRRNLVAFLRERKDLRPALGWLFQRPRFTVRVRPRPFLAITADDQREISEIVDDYLEVEA